MRRLALVTLVVDDYDAALAFYCGILGFELIENTPLSEEKRWVVVAPNANGCRLLLAKAARPKQRMRVGDQTGGRVAFFLETDDLKRDRDDWAEKGVWFEGATREEPYGLVAVFRDLYGNRWDLIQPTRGVGGGPAA